MKMPGFAFHFLILAISAGVVNASPSAPAIPPASEPADAPWEQPRDIAAFQSLLARSPFSLPTAEESSPLAERFSLTGAVDINGETMVFVIDRTTQARQMLSKKPNQRMSLVEYLPNLDPRKMKAIVQVDGQIATIAFNDTVAPQPASPGPSPSPGQTPLPSQFNRAMPSVNNSVAPLGIGATPPKPTTIVNVPPPLPGSPAFKQQGNPSASPGRRVHRRTTISDQPAPGQ